MSIATVVTRGYGTFGDIPHVVTGGYSLQGDGVIVYSGVSKRAYDGVSLPQRLDAYVVYYDTDPAP